MNQPTTAQAQATIDTWEGYRQVVDPAGNIYTGTWAEDESSTHGQWFLKLVDAAGNVATGFGGLTPAEATKYGLVAAAE